MLTLEAIGVRVTDSGITHVVCRPAGGEAEMRSVEGLVAFINSGNELYLRTATAVRRSTSLQGRSAARTSVRKRTTPWKTIYSALVVTRV